jgi:hypothetical protein
VLDGHERLKAAGREHFMGVGRASEGAQTHDYWRDPFGHLVEHCFGGDRYTAAMAAERTVNTDAAMRRAGGQA